LGAALWLLCRVARSRLITTVTLVSFGARVVLAEALYVVSAFNLPLWTSLHMPGGFWLLAPDAAGYDLAARQLLGLADPAGLAPEASADPFISIVLGLYRAIGVNPSTVLLLCAFLTAACVPLLFVAAQNLSMPPWAATITAIVAGFWPSSFAWSAQLLKDPIQWVGICAAIAGSVRLLGNASPVRRSETLLAGALLVAGTLLTTLVRGYSTILILLTAVIGLGLAFAVNRRHVRTWLPQAGVLLLALTLGAFPLRTSMIGVSHMAASLLTPKAQAIEASVQTAASSLWGHLRPGPPSGSQVAAGDTVSQARAGNRVPRPPSGSQVAAGDTPVGSRPTGQISPAPEAPVVLEGAVADAVAACPIVSPLLAVRQGFENTGGASLTDTNLHFRSCRDVLAYIPRTLELSYLAPFPGQWLHPGSTTGPARYLAALDAVMLWVLAPGLVASMIRLVREPHGARLMILLYLVFLGFSLGLAVSNFGTLFRLRLQGILPECVLAADGWVLIVSSGLERLGAAGLWRPQTVGLRLNAEAERGGRAPTR